MLCYESWIYAELDYVNGDKLESYNTFIYPPPLPWSFPIMYIPA